jgi:hypothetical protein
LDPFENFKDIGSSVEAHRKAIWKFSKDKSTSVLAITSIQGSGKTTAIVDIFASSRDAILLTQSNEKLEELVEIINKKYPDLQYHAIWGLENCCETYLDDEELQTEDKHKELLETVGKYRDIGIFTRDIHSRICSKEDCEFIVQDTTFEGRTIQTVDRFVQQIAFGGLFKGLHPGRLVLMDEADGIIDLKTVPDVVSLGLDSYKKEIVSNTSALLPPIYELVISEGEITRLAEKYRELLQDINGNTLLIKQITGIIRILTQGYFVKNKGTCEIPTFFLLTQKILWQRMKLVIGTASMRNHRIRFTTLKDYFNLALFLLFEKISEIATMDKTKAEKFQRMEELYDHLGKLKPDIQEFSHNYVPGIVSLYSYNAKKHSYSMNHYRQAFRKDNEDDDLRKAVWKEVVNEITLAMRFWELQRNRKAEKVLLITFRTVADQIERYRKQKKKKGNRHRDIFTNMDVLPLFSNRMHGINADKLGYDLIITLGDPLDRSLHDFTKTMGIGMANKHGFRIDLEGRSPELKETIFRTMISELLEAFHRGRGTIDVVALSNFLHQPEPENQAIIEKILRDDNIVFVDLRKMIESFRNKARSRHGTKEMKVFIGSLNEELQFDLDL